jgi:DNA-binding NarL/FixJ family response regulator
MPARKKPRKSGPSLDRSWYQPFIDDARKAAITEIEAPGLLTRLRAGDKLASTHLQEKLAYLIYRGRDGELDANQISEAEIQRKATAITIAVSRLAANDVTADGIIKFVIDEFVRSVKASKREETPYIKAPATTNWVRKKNGQEPHPDIKRIDHELPPLDHQYDDYSDGFKADSVLHDPPDNDDEDTMANLIEKLTDNEFESEILRMISHGYSYTQIAATLSTSKYAVERAVSNVRDRASKRAG